MPEQPIRWNVKVSKETDLTLRTYLGAHGMKKGDLSRFIEQAVRAYLFHSAIDEIKAKNADADPEELQALIDEAVAEVRAERHQMERAGKG
jgi:Ribbon-helix-helix domain